MPTLTPSGVRPRRICSQGCAVRNVLFHAAGGVVARSTGNGERVARPDDLRDRLGRREKLAEAVDRAEEGGGEDDEEDSAKDVAVFGRFQHREFVGGGRRLLEMFSLRFARNGRNHNARADLISGPACTRNAASEYQHNPTSRSPGGIAWK